MTKIKKLEKRKNFRILTSDLDGLKETDYLVIEIENPGHDRVKVMVKHILDRYERGMGTPSNRPSKDWIENGEHKASTGIPQWLKKLAKS